VLAILCFRRNSENRNTGCSGVVIRPLTFIQAPCITARVLLLLQTNDECSKWIERITYNTHVQFFFFISRPVGVVGIVTRYGLDYPGIDLGRGDNLSNRSHRPWVQPASYTMGKVYFPRVKWQKSGVKEGVGLYFHSPLGFHGLF
jgi:hypothetical protein